MLHPLQMGMLATDHPFVFRSLERSLVCLLCLEDGQLFVWRDVSCFGDIHGTSVSTCGVECSSDCVPI
jgi:hypothetical protein